MFSNKIHVRISSLALPIAFLAASCTSAPNAAVQQDLSSADDVIEAILEWWEGDYDNNAQIAALKADGAPIWQKGQYEEGKTFGGHLPVTASYRKVNIPAIGDNLLYVEEKTFKEDHYRQRIYSFIKDDETNGVRLRMWSFLDKEKYWGAIDNLSTIKNITPASMRKPTPDCDMIVKPLEDGRLHMKMKSEACKYKTSAFDYQVILGPNSYDFRDRIFDTETKIVTMTAGSFTYHKLDKVK